MPKKVRGILITVPTEWTIYELTEPVVQQYTNLSTVLPSQVVLEALVVMGRAKRLGAVASMEFKMGDHLEEGEENIDPFSWPGKDEEEEEAEDGA